MSRKRQRDSTVRCVGILEQWVDTVIEFFPEELITVLLMYDPTPVVLELNNRYQNLKTPMLMNCLRTYDRILGMMLQLALPGTGYSGYSLPSSPHVPDLEMKGHFLVSYVPSMYFDPAEVNYTCRAMVFYIAVAVVQHKPLPPMCSFYLTHRSGRTGVTTPFWIAKSVGGERTYPNLNGCMISAQSEYRFTVSELLCLSEGANWPLGSSITFFLSNTKEWTGEFWMTWTLRHGVLLAT